MGTSRITPSEKIHIIRFLNTIDSFLRAYYSEYKRYPPTDNDVYLFFHHLPYSNAPDKDPTHVWEHLSLWIGRQKTNWFRLFTHTKFAHYEGYSYENIVFSLFEKHVNGIVKTQLAVGIYVDRYHMLLPVDIISMLPNTDLYACPLHTIHNS